ncbi:MAG: hypothetical protein RMJ51_00890 [Candidatus Calescibacterium sp.]|nr:hypothetical protein [Candidatus Calescibacterium sp.]MCX7972101.1 hypothetical protein [bacterium]MDW8194789.1 hypothetical protein [Candidatus Calescibacterium sp.]
METVFDITNQAKLLSKRLKNILYEPRQLDNSKVEIQENPELVIRRIIKNGQQNVVISAVGFYGLQSEQKFWENEIFINNTKRVYRISKKVYPEYIKFTQDQTTFVILSIYAEIYSSIIPVRTSKTKKVPFGTFSLSTYH